MPPTRDREKKLKHLAFVLGLNMSWSPVNQAWFLQVRMSRSQQNEWPMAAIKTSLDDVQDYLSDFQHSATATC